MTTFDQRSGGTAAPSQDRTAVAEQPTPRFEERTTRWGPVWVGAVVALPVYVVLQMLFIALGWIAFGVDGAGAGVAASIASALLAIIALFVGGLAGGTASSWRGGSPSAALQGAMTWALSAVGLLLLGLLGGGALAGSLGGLAQLVVATGPQQFAGNPAVVAQAIQAVQNAAGWSALWLGLAFAAAVIGTGTGASLTKGPRPASGGHGH
ncbi:hypothetical protein [Actinomycetospora straminea]|uniref:Permease n=1 Tax=Actinomycetospora straminea TaxID=663607 RepID=A0ABP9EIT2_9PSEU|nr:hypothetical protein [Actinomycetospora straminea]MDD7933138.1 hypothetical protein [Actinomycetospora straminea]